MEEDVVGMRIEIATLAVRTSQTDFDDTADNAARSSAEEHSEEFLLKMEVRLMKQELKEFQTRILERIKFWNCRKVAPKIWQWKQQQNGSNVLRVT